MYAQPMNNALNEFDVEAIRNDFSILKQETDPSLIYLDSAATSQTPDPVIEAMDAYYRTYNSNIHRGIYRISEEATAKYEEAPTADRTFHQRPSFKPDYLYTQYHRVDQPRCV